MKTPNAARLIARLDVLLVQVKTMSDVEARAALAGLLAEIAADRAPATLADRVFPR